jgi:RNA polymerase sigma factor (sigma-70 family)
MKAGPIERRKSTHPPTAGGPSAAAKDDPDRVGGAFDSAGIAQSLPSADSASMALDEPCLDELADHTPTARATNAAAQTSEAELARWLDALVDRDERALAALYDTTIGRVFGFVKRIVRNDAMAQEVVEDAYFQLWRQAARYDPARGQPMAWILAVARSRAIDALRRESRFAHDSLDVENPPQIEGIAAPADELLEVARQHADLHEALMLLGAQPRQLVSLAFFRGLSHEEIAEQMRMPLGTVKSQIRRAMLTLRETLACPAPGASAAAPRT